MAYNNIPQEMNALAADVLTKLRKEQQPGFDALSDSLQRSYTELGTMCLGHLLAHPDPSRLRKLGPNEEAYGVDMLRTNGASLRVNYYTAAGSKILAPGAISAETLDVQEYGTPHNHRGHIAAAVPLGTLVHHTFHEKDGKDYTAGRIQFEKQASGTSSSFFLPDRLVDLSDGASGSFDASTGYRMDADTIHIVSWPEPTVTVWFNDGIEVDRPSTTYMSCDQDFGMGRDRGLSIDEQNLVWSSFAKLAHNE